MTHKSSCVLPKDMCLVAGCDLQYCRQAKRVPRPARMWIFHNMHTLHEVHSRGDIWHRDKRLDYLLDWQAYVEVWSRVNTHRSSYMLSCGFSLPESYNFPRFSYSETAVAYRPDPVPQRSSNGSRGAYALPACNKYRGRSSASKARKLACRDRPALYSGPRKCAHSW